MVGRLQLGLASRALAFAAAALALVAVVAPSADSAHAVRAGYRVESIVISITGGAKASAATDRSGTTGRMADTLSATFRGAAARGGPAAGLETPVLKSQYICNPACPTYAATGSMTAKETFTPGKGKSVSCGRTAKVPNGLTGQVYVTSSDTTTSKIFVTIQVSQVVDMMFAAVIGTQCTLPIYYPTNVQGQLTPETLPVSVIGAKTIKVVLKQPLVPSPTQWASTGGTVIHVTAVLARAS